MKYNKIVNGTLADLKTGKEIYNNQFILMQDNKNFTDFDVDLTGDLFFNTDFEITEIISETYINSLDELYHYCTANKVTIPKHYITKNGLICGGEKDYIINNDLVGTWLNN